MSFYQFIEPAARVYAERMDALTSADVRRAVGSEHPSESDFLALLSPEAEPLLEEMAGRAHDLTVRYFGRTIQLFTPLYLANHCSNHCVYCGFNCLNKIDRSQLTLDQVEEEGRAIAATGLKHLLILTGEAPAKAGVDYLESCIKILSDFFPSVSLEVFPMKTEEYERLIRAGADGLTVFQETYDETLYAELHPAGPKRNYRFRLDCPERGCMAGMRTVNIGALLGLDQWRRETFFTGLHAAYLQRRYPETDISISLPRMRPHAGEFQPTCIVSDAEMVQIMLALRIFLPRAGITISTREEPEFRENILPLGVTRMSAGVSTAVGGHTRHTGEAPQFDISDPRSVDEMCAVLRAHGYQPVYKDWHPLAMEGA